MNFDRAQEHFYQEVRRFAVLLLTTRAHQALNASPRISGDSAQAEGGQLTGWPPAPADYCRSLSVLGHPGTAFPRSETALHTLASLLLKEARNVASPAETREIAELLELLDFDEEAVPWWGRAAARGDEDAQDYLEILLQERTQTANTQCGATRESGRKDFDAFIDSARTVTSFCAPLTSGRPRPSPTPSEQEWDTPRQLRLLVDHTIQEIEKFLAHPDQMTDGRTR